MDPDTLANTLLAGLPSTALDFDLSHDGLTLAFLSETESQPAEVSVWKGGSVAKLTSTNPQVSQWTLGTMREVQWRNPHDGHTVYGVLRCPRGITAGRRYKTVIHMHGGPEEAFTVGFSANWYKLCDDACVAGICGAAAELSRLCRAGDRVYRRRLQGPGRSRF